MNDVSEYEALVILLIFALQIGIQKLRVQEDSKLVIQQINGEFAFKESVLAFCRAIVQRFVRFLSSIQLEHVPRSHKKHADALATLASNVDIGDEAVGVKVIRRFYEPP